MSNNDNPDPVVHSPTFYQASPSSFSSSIPVPLKVTTSDASKISKADFVFLIDTTGSMAGYIDQVKTNLINFSNKLVSDEIDVRFAVVDFRDIFVDGADSTQVKTFSDSSIWTSDVLEVETMLNSLTVGGGGDGPETPTDAMAKFYNSAVGSTSADLLFRNGASRFAFLLTDADYKISAEVYDTYYSTMSQDVLNTMEAITSVYRRASIYTSVVSRAEYNDVSSDYYVQGYHDLYTETGGKYIDITSPDYSVVMSEIAEWVSAYKDTDGDGLLDTWEMYGVDTNDDGSPDLDLAALGADVNKPDIFVYYDWMEKPRSGLFWDDSKSTKPSSTYLDLVVRQFANHDINLHIIEGRAIPYQADFDLGDDGLYTNWNKLATEYFPREYWTTFRYCLFVDKAHTGKETFSGIAEEIPGQFFLIATGYTDLFNRKFDVAVTFMHELGHTLGLMHGGNEHTNYKPNYLSIMNYLYSHSGLMLTGAEEFQKFNYSEYILPALDETAIDESKGLDPDSATTSKGLSLGAKWFLKTKGNTKSKRKIAGESINFNDSWFGSIDSGTVAVDFYIESYDAAWNPVIRADDKIQSSINDWNAIKFKGGAVGGFSLREDDALISPDTSAVRIPEPSPEEIAAMKLYINHGELEITSIKPDIIFSGYTMQNINIVLTNPFDSEVSADLTVSSSALSSSYTDRIVLADGESVDVTIPIEKVLSPDVYSLSVDIKTLEGFTTASTASFTVVSLEPVTVREGATLTLDSKYIGSYTASIEDTSIATISGAIITGVKAGRTYINISDTDGSVLCNIPLFVTSNAETGPQRINPTTPANNNNNSGSTPGSSGGGCSAGLAGVSLLLAVSLFLKKHKQTS